jgi:hypothetical protein
MTRNSNSAGRYDPGAGKRQSVMDKTKSDSPEWGRSLRFNVKVFPLVSSVTKTAALSVRYVLYFSIFFKRGIMIGKSHGQSAR